jgi:hypothetical protein
MYEPRWLQYIDLPPIPEALIKELDQNFDAFAPKSQYENYVWSDSFNHQINDWCQKNICQNMYWGFQIMQGDVPKHKDVGTQTKFIYLITSGGDQVHTRFWADDGETQLADYVTECGRWHLLKADTMHSVEGIQPKSVRFSVTGRVF